MRSGVAANSSLDTNNMIVLFPQAISDSSSHAVWNGGVLPNPNGCWDWVGWYGPDADQIGGMCKMITTRSQYLRFVGRH
jgi:hypothetical protein